MKIFRTIIMLLFFSVFVSRLSNAAELEGNNFIATNFDSIKTIMHQQHGLNTRILINGTIFITDSIHIPSNILVEFARDGVFDISADKKVTFDGNIVSGPKQIFSGMGNVCFSTSSFDIDSTWFGVKCTHSNDDTTSIQRALWSATGNNLIFPLNVSCNISSTLYIPSDININFSNSIISRNNTHKVFDLIVNDNPISGNSNITISNLTIDGKKDQGNKSATNKQDRFSGIKFVNVKSSQLTNVTVKNTVNAENIPNDEFPEKIGRAGIYLDRCNDISLSNVNGYYNDRTAIFFNDSSNISIVKSDTGFNKGSGISSNNCYKCTYKNITTHDNGYSQLSVNGKYSTVDNVDAWNGSARYSNINIGHDIQSAASDYTIATNLSSKDSAGWGITISGSKHVTLSKIKVLNSQDEGIKVFGNSSDITIENANVESGQKSGVVFKSGNDHVIRNSEVHNNGLAGIYFEKATSGTVGPRVKSYSNGTSSAGLVASHANIKILRSEFNDLNTNKSQEYGIWLDGGNTEIIESNISSIRKTSNPQIK